jgi:hypothetical protein
MKLMVEKVDVWAAGIKDQAASLAAVLAGLRDAGADLNFVLSRRSAEKPGAGVVFVTPLRGDAEIEKAASLGFSVTSSVHSVRVEGENRRGIAAEVTAKLGAAGINLRGLSAGVIGPRFIMYIGLDSAEDAARAMKILQRL